MRNDDDSQEYAETPSVRRCGHCGDPLLSQRRGARFCSRECKELARARRRRASRRVTAFRAKHPLEAATLDELYRRAGPPGRAGHDDRLSEFSDYGDLPEDHDDDDRLGDDDDQDAGHGAYFNDSVRVGRQAEAIRARYAARIKPHLAAQKRNGGVKLAVIARLEAECKIEVDALMKAHWRKEAHDRAAREQPRYLASAHERQAEQAALRAFGNDLGRGHRSASQAPSAGRDTRDVFIF